ncbi:MAG: prolipoprotein diacylglyceryl transferase [Pseudomonadota bacterium]
MSIFVLPFPVIDPVAVELGPIAIRWYGLAYVVGLLLGYIYAKRICATPSLWRAEKPAVEKDHIEDFLLWAGIGVIVGGRLGFVAFYNTQFYLENPLEILKIWQGGMAFHGGLIGVIVAILLYTRRKNIAFLSFCDVMAVAAPFGLFFGRVANFINDELWGRVTDVPWAMVFPGAGPEPRHPSQLYEAALEGLVLWIILRWLTHSRQSLATPGLTAGIFGIGYASARIFVEFFRQPDPQLGFLFGGFATMGMILSVPVLIGGIALIAASRAAK